MTGVKLCIFVIAFIKISSSNYKEEEAARFVDSMIHVSKIIDLDKEFCDCPISIQEVTDSVITLKNNKSLGMDLLQSFTRYSLTYKVFPDDLAPFLLKVFEESLAKYLDASGLQFNLNKCELVAVKDNALTSICNISVKDTVN